MNASTVIVFGVDFNRYESTTNVFGVDLTMNESTVNVSVGEFLRYASILISTPLAVEANIGVISLK